MHPFIYQANYLSVCLQSTGVPKKNITWPQCPRRARKPAGWSVAQATSPGCRLGPTCRRMAFQSLPQAEGFGEFLQRWDGPAKDKRFTITLDRWQQWRCGNGTLVQEAPWPWADRTRGWSTPIAELMIDDPMSFLLECRLHLWQFLKFEKLTLEWSLQVDLLLLNSASLVSERWLFEQSLVSCVVPIEFLFRRLSSRVPTCACSWCPYLTQPRTI